MVLCRPSYVAKPEVSKNRQDEPRFASARKGMLLKISTITLLVLQMTLLLQIEKIGLDHHIPIIVFTQKKYSK